MKKLLILFVLVLVAMQQKATCQDSTSFSKRSVKTFVSLTYNEGQYEQGFGLPLGIGYQWAMLKDRLRLHTSLTNGSFYPFIITGAPAQFYRTTTVGFYSDLDVLKHRSLSLMLSAGGFVNYSRGNMSSNNYQSQDSRIGFRNFYYGYYVAAGVRIAPRDSRYAYELFIPVGGHFGNKSYLSLQFLRFGVDIKL